MDTDGRITVKGEHTHSVDDTGIMFTVLENKESDVKILLPSQQANVNKVILKTIEPNEENKIYIL